VFWLGDVLISGGKQYICVCEREEVPHYCVQCRVLSVWSVRRSIHRGQCGQQMERERTPAEIWDERAATLHCLCLATLLTVAPQCSTFTQLYKVGTWSSVPILGGV